MKLDLRHLVLVKTIVEEGSLTKASEALYLSQSALSHQLRDLEDKLDTQVFSRANKKLVLTEAGKFILQSAQKVVCEVSQLEKRIDEIKKGQRGSIQLCTECSTSYHWLPKIMQSYAQDYPLIHININTEATADPIHFLKTGDIDIAIMCLCCQEEDKSLVYTPLFSDEIVAVVSKQNPLSSKAFMLPEDFLGHTLYVYDAPIKEQTSFQKILSPVGFSPDQVKGVQLTEAIIEMVHVNLGLSLMARWMVQPYLQSKDIACIPVRHESVQRTWYIVTLKESISPTRDTFIKHMLDFSYQDFKLAK